MGVRNAVLAFAAALDRDSWRRPDAAIQNGVQSADERVAANGTTGRRATAVDQGSYESRWHAGCRSQGR